MSSNYEVTGMVLSSVPAGEYDRRVEILTRERGRISGFATGARRPGSPVMAAAQPFVFGTFVISEGRTANKIREARVDNFFAGLRKDVSGSLYGTYFMEVLQYVTRATSIGDFRSLAIHPASTLYIRSTPEMREAAGVFDDTIRVSVGIEDVEDLIDDFRQALKA